MIPLETSKLHLSVISFHQVANMGKECKRKQQKKNT